MGMILPISGTIDKLIWYAIIKHRTLKIEFPLTPDNLVALLRLKSDLQLRLGN
jgi:hypothetical protein